MDKSKTYRVKQAIAEYVKNHPEQTYREISNKLGISLPYVSKIANDFGYGRRRHNVLMNIDLKKLED